ncbi:MAG: hypothetical protein K0R54_1597 [Clostridiaceae bacterium]|jgi:hypothetical protein|nr:hypothetical protein [Clostridiaceae bacterium]
MNYIHVEIRRQMIKLKDVLFIVEEVVILLQSSKLYNPMPTLCIS